MRIVTKNSKFNVNMKELSVHIIIAIIIVFFQITLLLQDKVKKIMDSKNFGLQYEIGDELKPEVVTIKTLNGRTEFTCTCNNGTRFCNLPTICYHRLAVILYCQREIFE